MRCPQWLLRLISLAQGVVVEAAELIIMSQQSRQEMQFTVPATKKAKAADQNRPKAPKSKFFFFFLCVLVCNCPFLACKCFIAAEWEGDNLRNSRVACNVILPLVSSKTSKVPLITIKTTMVEYNTIVINTLGTHPKSILGNCLHDIRFLLLRLAYGEASERTAVVDHPHQTFCC
jgi:hypothetical protein